MILPDAGQKLWGPYTGSAQNAEKIISLTGPAETEAVLPARVIKQLNGPLISWI